MEPDRGTPVVLQLVLHFGYRYRLLAGSAWLAATVTSPQLAGLIDGQDASVDLVGHDFSQRQRHRSLRKGFRLCLITGVSAPRVGANPKGWGVGGFDTSHFS